MAFRAKKDYEKLITDLRPLEAYEWQSVSGTAQIFNNSGDYVLTFRGTSFLAVMNKKGAINTLWKLRKGFNQTAKSLSPLTR